MYVYIKRYIIIIIIIIFIIIIINIIKINDISCGEKREICSKSNKNFSQLRSSFTNAYEDKN